MQRCFYFLYFSLYYLFYTVSVRCNGVFLYYFFLLYYLFYTVSGGAKLDQLNLSVHVSLYLSISVCLSVYLSISYLSGGDATARSSTNGGSWDLKYADDSLRILYAYGTVSIHTQTDRQTHTHIHAHTHTWDLKYADDSFLI
jgi:hypothetical protein